MRLRTLLTFSALSLGLVGLLAAAALVWTTNVLGQATRNLHLGIESIRAAEALEIELLQLERNLELAPGTDPGPVGSHQELQQWIQRAAENVGDEKEAALVAKVTSEVNAYLAAEPAQRESALREALKTSDALTRLNAEEAARVRAGAQRVNRLANLIALCAAVLLLVGIGLVVLAARYQIYWPLVHLRRALSAYRRGERSERAREEGPAELRELASEFNEMASALARREQLQLQFVAGVAHDLRNPLQALRLSAGLLAREAAASPGEKGADLIRKISNQTDRLTRMVSDLLDRTQIEAGALTLKREQTDLTELAGEVVALHQATTERHTLRLEAPAEPVISVCDSGRVNQVLTNLVNNAIKYSPEGGDIRVALRREGQKVVLSVTDPGVGVPAGELERIFEPFRRSDATRAEIPGIGLGLSVSRRIVRAHGGEISARHAPGGGTVFTVELPDPEVEA